MTRLVALALFVALAWLPAARAVDLARMYDQTALAPWQQTYAGFVRQQLQPIYEQLSAEERGRVARLNVDVPLHGAQRAPFEFTVQLGDSVRIDLPASAIKFLGDVIASVSWIGRNGYDTRPLVDYLGLLKYEPTPAPGGRLPDPIAALGLPRGAAEDPAIQRDVGVLLSSAVRFSLLHALGHAVTGSDPTATGDAALAQDLRADAFALDVMKRLGAPPNGIALMIWVQSQLQPSTVDAAADPRWAAVLNGQRHPLTAARLRALAAGLTRESAAFAGRQSDASAATAAISAAIQQITALAQGFDDREAQVLSRRIGNTARWTMLLPHRPGEMLAIPETLRDAGARTPFHGAFDGAIKTAAGEARVRILLWRAGDDVIGIASSGAGLTHITGRVQADTLRFTHESFDLRGAGAFAMQPGADTLSGEYGMEGAATGAGTIAATRSKP